MSKVFIPVVKIGLFGLNVFNRWKSTKKNENILVFNTPTQTSRSSNRFFEKSKTLNLSSISDDSSTLYLHPFEVQFLAEPYGPSITQNFQTHNHIHDELNRENDNFVIQPDLLCDNTVNELESDTKLDQQKQEDCSLKNSSTGSEKDETKSNGTCIGLTDCDNVSSFSQSRVLDESSGDLYASSQTVGSEQPKSLNNAVNTGKAQSSKQDCSTKQPVPMILTPPRQDAPHLLTMPSINIFGMATTPTTPILSPTNLQSSKLNPMILKPDYSIPNMLPGRDFSSSLKSNSFQSDSHSISSTNNYIPNISGMSSTPSSIRSSIPSISPTKIKDSLSFSTLNSPKFGSNDRVNSSTTDSINISYLDKLSLTESKQCSAHHNQVISISKNPPKLQVSGREGFWWALNAGVLQVYRDLNLRGICNKIKAEIVPINKVSNAKFSVIHIKVSKYIDI